MAGERRRFRPTGIIAVMWAGVAILTILTAVIGSQLPESARFTTSQNATIWALVGVVGLFALIISMSQVTADDEQIRWVNGLRRHKLSWDEVAGISMNPGAPWPTLVTKDDRRFILFAIQGSEGRSATNAVQWLAGHVK